MSVKELDRITVLEQVKKRRITQKEAAKQLVLSVRQVKRLAKAYREKGKQGLLSKRRRRPSNRKFDDEIEQQAKAIVLGRYADFGPTLASEKLLERDQIRVNRETLRQWMSEWGCWKPRRRKEIKVHPQRKRRSCLGELVQLDGSPHDWFEGRSPPCCLIVLIDDATSRILYLQFERSETTEAYFKAIKSHLKRYGRPLAYYSDRHGIFRVNQNALTGTGETQFSRALKELGVQGICANSPQAKGRVERANKTLQDRLVKEMRLQGVNTMEQANAFLEVFREDHNRRFSKPPANEMDCHRREIPEDEILNIIFSEQGLRKVSKNLELSYEGSIYQIQPAGQGYGLRRAMVLVSKQSDGTILLLHRGKPLKYLKLEKNKHVSPIVTSKQLNNAVDILTNYSACTHKPRWDHPWHQYRKILKRRPCELATTPQANCSVNNCLYGIQSSEILTSNHSENSIKSQ